MTKIMCISDTHRQENEVIIPECDIFIHSGDFDLYELQDVIKLNKWLGTLPATYKIITAGNHDFFSQSHEVLTREHLTNAYLLINESLTINGIKFYGSPITPTFGNWAWMADRGNRIKRYWDEIPVDTDFLITHCVTPDHKTLTYNLKWVSLGDIK